MAVIQENQEEPVRILCVFSTLDRGGSESMCMNLYRSIDRKLVQFDFVKHTPKEGAFEKEILDLGGRIYTAPRYKIYNHVQYIRWWKNHLKRHPEHTIIHGHYFTISAVYFKTAKKAGRITVGHCHCTPRPSELWENKIRKVVENYYMSKIEKYSDYCLACSKDAGKWLFLSKSFRVLNNAIDAQKFRFNKTTAKEIRKKLKLGDSFIIGSVGRFNLQKNPLGIVDIFYQIQLRRPNSKFIWVGDGPMRKDAEEKTRSLGLTDKVLFLGVRSDVPKLLQAMDVFVFPSFYEGLGVALVEAQAAGVECFCSDAVPEEAGVTDLCHFLPLDNLNKWEEEICKIPANREHPDMMEAIINADYDIHTTSNWLQNFYLSIAGKE